MHGCGAEIRLGQPKTSLRPPLPLVPLIALIAMGGPRHRRPNGVLGPSLLGDLTVCAFSPSVGLSVLFVSSNMQYTRCIDCIIIIHPHIAHE